MKKVILMSLIILALTACSEEAQPYEEVNASGVDSQQQGYIDTH